MAYVFNKIDEALNGGAPTSQSNIFNAGSVSPDPTSGPTGSGSAVKTSTDTDLNGTIGSSSGSAMAGGGLPKESFNQNVGAALAKNQANFSSLPAQYQTSVGKINQGLQDEANSYTTNQDTKTKADYSLGADTIQKAMSGDAGAGTQVTGLLTKAKPQVDEFKSSVDTNIKDLSSLNSSAGLSNLLSRNAQSNYSGGMAGLDSMLLGQNKGFIQARQGLNNTQNDIRARAADTAPITQKAQALAETNYKDGTGFVRDMLTTRQKEIQDKAIADQKAHNERIKGLSSNNKDYVKQQQEQAIRDLLKSAQGQGFADDINAAAYSLQNRDPNFASQYYRAGSEVKDPSQFYNADNAQGFNLIESLLGESDNIAAGGPLGPDQSYDTKGFQTAVQARAQEIERDRLARIQAQQVAAEKEAMLTQLATQQQQANAFVPGQAAINPAPSGYIDAPTGFIFTEEPNLYAGMTPVQHQAF